MIVFVAYFGAFIATRLISSWIYGEEVWKRYKHASLKVVLCVGCFQNILYCFSIVLNPLNLLPLMALSCSCGGLLGGLIIIASPLHALLLSTAPPVVICFVCFFAQFRPFSSFVLFRTETSYEKQVFVVSSYQLRSVFQQNY